MYDPQNDAKKILDSIYEIKDPMGEDATVIATAIRTIVKLCSWEDFGHRLIDAQDLLKIAEELDNL